MYSYVCAVVASSTAVSDPVGARKLGHASIGLSVAGIIVSVVIVIIVVVVYVSALASSVVSSATRSAASCEYYIYGTCYEHRTYYNGYYCSGQRSGIYCYYN